MASTITMRDRNNFFSFQIYKNISHHLGIQKPKIMINQIINQNGSISFHRWYNSKPTFQRIHFWRAFRAIKILFKVYIGHVMFDRTIQEKGCHKIFKFVNPSKQGVGNQDYSSTLLSKQSQIKVFKVWKIQAPKCFWHAYSSTLLSKQGAWTPKIMSFKIFSGLFLFL